MSNEHRSPDDELTAVEASLANLVPARSQINRDMIMFHAGRASARSRFPQILVRHAVAASFALIALVEGMILIQRPTDRVVERLVVVREPARVAPEEPAPVFSSGESAAMGPTAHDRQVWQVLRYGLDGLSSPALNLGAPSAVSRRSLREEIDEFLDTGDPS